MSSPETILVRCGSKTIRIEVQDTPPIAASDVADRASSSAAPEELPWELVTEEESGERGSELSVCRTEPPLFLAHRVGAAGTWSARDRILRAFDFGKRDCIAALESTPQLPRDQFPLASRVFVILYDPSGNWPRYTKNLQAFYNAVKIEEGSRVPDRRSPWKPGIVSRGFASISEAEAYLAGASCRLPREPFEA